MKNLYLLMAAACFYGAASAQSIVSVASGSKLSVAGGTTFSAGGIVLKPTDTYSITGNLTKNATAANTVSGTYVSRVYAFNNNTTPFKGSIKFYYADNELNGLDESTLQLNVYDHAWQPVPSATNDAIANYVASVSIDNVVLNELLLKQMAGVLPVNYIDIAAARDGKTIAIKWNATIATNDLSFSVERSLDGRNWSAISPAITANKLPLLQQYSFVDRDYTTEKIWYRIQQANNTGRYTYSKTALVAAVNGKAKLTLYPNPVTDAFYLSGSNNIEQLSLFNNNGSLVSRWTSPQAKYTISKLSAGTYHLKVQYKDQTESSFIINKQ